MFLAVYGVLLKALREMLSKTYKQEYNHFHPLYGLVMVPSYSLEPCYWVCLSILLFSPPDVSNCSSQHKQKIWSKSLEKKEKKTQQLSWKFNWQLRVKETRRTNSSRWYTVSIHSVQSLVYASGKYDHWEICRITTYSLKSWKGENKWSVSSVAVVSWNDISMLASHVSLAPATIRRWRVVFV